MRKSLDAYIRKYGGSRSHSCRSWLRSALKSDFLRKIGETFATRVLLIGIGLISSVIIARILGPQGRGLFAVAGAVGAIGVQFGNLGLHASNTYTVAKNPELLPVIVGNSFMVSFIIGGTGSALAWLVFTLFPTFAPVTGKLLVLALAWIPLGLAYLLLQNILLGIHQIRAYNVVELASQTAGIILIGILIILKTVSVESIFSTAIATLAVSVLWAYRSIRPHVTGRLSISLSLFKNNLPYGVKAYMTAFFAFLVLRIDLLMVNILLGAEQAGYYSIAVTMADMVYMLPVVIGTVLFPKLSSMPDQEKWDLSKRTALLVCLVMVVAAAVAAALSKPLVRILFGDLFLPAVPAFLWLMPGIVMLSVNTIFMNFFASTGMPLITVYGPGTAALVNILLNLALIPAWGIVGASLSSVLAYGLMLAFSMLFLFRTGVLTSER